MKYYSWKDIDRVCQKSRDQWENLFWNIETFPDELVVYLKEDVEESDALSTLEKFFPKNMDLKDLKIKLDSTGEKLNISFEREYMEIQKKCIPSFEEIIYKKNAYPNYKLQDLSCPVIVFHSYKGGVGRTLSLLAFAMAWTKNNNEKLLIIDSDLEAPGLTWLQRNNNENEFSYLDLLTLIQDSNDIEKVVNTASNEIGNLNIPIETEQEIIQHIFVPTFRYDEQLFDIYASPDTIINTRNKQYVLAEIFSKIAVNVGAAAVLVDLRAGISEYSAPLLFDPRVKKYFVTSTSAQSIIGTCKVLEYISKGMEINETSILPGILLTMIPPSLEKKEKERIFSSLLESFKPSDMEEESLFDNVITELPFASELVHLTDFKQIFSALKGRDMYFNIEVLVQQYYGMQNSDEIYVLNADRNIILEKIRSYADNQITAEANGALKLLLTQPIKNLCSRFKLDVPNVVIRGAKGSGKTFLYRRLLEAKEWNLFYENTVEKKIQIVEKTYFIPLFAPRNIAQLTLYLRKCIDNFNENILFANVEKDIYLKNTTILERQDSNTDWLKFWKKLFVTSLNSEFTTLDDINSQLKSEKKRVVFLIDGLEEILKEVSEKTEQKTAIQVLCQDVVNLLAAKYENLGIIVFLRSDMAQNAITTNYEQFKQSYAYAELKWNSDEALKLAVWLVGEAVDGFYNGIKQIENAPKEIIDKHLEKLWGLKLGKPNSNEAYSSRWILAALSDFNGQLQARDIIRFLKYAAVPGSSKKAPYNDRILMPTEIRNAVSTCSEEKITEIRMEYTFLNPIFKKLEELPSDKKVLPLNLDEETILTPSEEKLMTQEGYLVRDGEKSYLPEIVRHALKFKYGKGARPKVLSLLLKH